MGCTFSGLNAIYNVVGGGGDVWINLRRFRIVKQLGEGGFSFVYLVKELISDNSSGDPSRISGDNLYALKKVIIETEEQLELVKKEIHMSSLFNHPNLLPLLEHSIITVKGPQEGAWNHEAYLLFPIYLEGTLLDVVNSMHEKKEFLPTPSVLHIFRQICAGVSYMHTYDPPYAHNDLKPGNILLSSRKGQPPLAIIMDFGNATLARRSIHTRSEALALQEWASQNCSSPYRAPELWDCPSIINIDGRTDVWSLGCTLFTMMYGISPFEYLLAESEGSMQLAVMSGQIEWPLNSPYPESLHQFLTWMLQPQIERRPTVEDVTIHVDKLLSKISSESLDFGE